MLVASALLLLVALKANRSQNKKLIKNNQILLAENELLRERNLHLKTKVLSITVKVEDHDVDIELLQKQMYQVHDWLGRLTISNLIETLVERVEEINEGETGETQYQSK
jgi:ferredoxin-fold anticodon binding domain-containing protein